MEREEEEKRKKTEKTKKNEKKRRKWRKIPWRGWTSRAIRVYLKDVPLLKSLFARFRASSSGAKTKGNRRKTGKRDAAPIGNVEKK